ncbi:uncharacterized protein BCR38DRAFT_494056 [Pseudomassariella vexata]|uniref:Uncharacterized protein n=1 Tax=Pseudomassariella vexata TaxID=1141098 RepID=A0A1Y2EKL8_9PEZI|nr:uncharacterized protein BCR38DRAFT_494056 [Pseudomassariella vexata]ORY72090.1 hypothetical protein BCR38DRAFT_494056 [Pseudomassariella vexata]
MSSMDAPLVHPGAENMIKFGELEADRQRFLKLGYALHGVPVFNDHDLFLKILRDLSSLKAFSGLQPANSTLMSTTTPEKLRSVVKTGFNHVDSSSDSFSMSPHDLGREFPSMQLQPSGNQKSRHNLTHVPPIQIHFQISNFPGSAVWTERAGPYLPNLTEARHLLYSWPALGYELPVCEAQPPVIEAKIRKWARIWPPHLEDCLITSVVLDHKSPVNWIPAEIASRCQVREVSESSTTYRFQGKILQGNRKVSITWSGSAMRTRKNEFYITSDATLTGELVVGKELLEALSRERGGEKAFLDQKPASSGSLRDTTCKKGLQGTSSRSRMEERRASHKQSSRVTKSRRQSTRSRDIV